MLVKKKPSGYYSDFPGRFFSDVDTPHDRHVFDRWLWNYRAGGPGFHWHPDVDVIYGDKHLLISADIPGVDEKDIDVLFDGHVLNIVGERKNKKKIKDDSYFIKERLHGKFHRVIHLPATADSKGLKARYENGVLEVLVPRKKESKKRSKKAGVSK